MCLLEFLNSFLQTLGRHRITACFTDLLMSRIPLKLLGQNYYSCKRSSQEEVNASLRDSWHAAQMQYDNCKYPRFHNNSEVPCTCIFFNFHSTPLTIPSIDILWNFFFLMSYRFLSSSMFSLNLQLFWPIAYFFKAFQKWDFSYNQPV